MVALALTFPIQYCSAERLVETLVPCITAQPHGSWRRKVRSPWAEGTFVSSEQQENRGLKLLSGHTHVARRRLL